jgi:hypothetical protein
MKTLYPDEPAPNLSGLNQQDQATIFNFRKQKAMEAQAAKKQDAEAISRRIHEKGSVCVFERRRCERLPRVYLVI